MESSWSVRKPPSTARSNVRSGCWSSCREIAGGLKEVGRKEATGIALPGKRAGRPRSQARLLQHALQAWLG